MGKSKRRKAIERAVFKRLQGEVIRSADTFIPDEWRWWPTLWQMPRGGTYLREIRIGYTVATLLHCGEEHEGRYGYYSKVEPEIAPNLTRSYKRRKDAKAKSYREWLKWKSKNNVYSNYREALAKYMRRRAERAARNRRSKISSKRRKEQ